MLLAYINTPSDWSLSGTLADIASLAPSGQNWMQYSSNVQYGPPVVPGDLSKCFELVITQTQNATRGNAVAVVALNSLDALAKREQTTLMQATVSALHSIIEGGANHIVLTPGTSADTVWSEAAVNAVREAVALAADQHGVALPTSFSAVPPIMAQCLGVGDTGAGIAWAVASGAQSVYHVAVASRLRPVSLRFPTTSARFIPQVAVEGFAEPPLPPLRRHFQACGGAPGQCDPLPDALKVSGAEGVETSQPSGATCLAFHTCPRSCAPGGFAPSSNTDSATLWETTLRAGTPPLPPTAPLTPPSTAATAS